MQPRLKQLSEQVVVVVGASSGIGLATARAAARRGAAVVLAARNEEDLVSAVESIRREGGRATYAVADVASPDAMEGVARTALDEFGGFDTWINCAATVVFGKLDEIPLEDKRRLFDVNFWGVVHGCRVAVPHLRRHGGALITIGSVLGDRSVPLQGIYSAAKHAVKGYIDALRMELEAEGAPIVVTLVKPGSIDTPLYQKGRTYTGLEPRPVPPVYAPEVAAEAILHCAEHPMRDLYVGAAGRAVSALESMAPRLTDHVLERVGFDLQQYETPVAADRADNLYTPVLHDGGEGGYYPGHVLRSSLYTRASLHPRALLGAVAMGVALTAAWRLLRRRPTATAGDVSVGLPVTLDADRGRPALSMPDLRDEDVGGLSPRGIADETEQPWRPADDGNALTRDNTTP